MKTIFALSTAFIKSGVAVIRVSGLDAKLSYEKLCRLDNLVPNRVQLCNIYREDQDFLIDRGLVIYFEGPHSFTGEDVVEFQVHGSIAVINMLLNQLAKMPSYRLAEPGEFSRRAFMNGKMDLTEAEGLQDLIEAETSFQLKQAQRQYLGENRRLFSELREDILRASADIEALIDFPDEDIPESLIKVVEARIREIISKILEILKNRDFGERARQGFQIAIIGEPNVGKSSILNLLAKRDVAITSDIAGTTRDVIEVHMDIDGYPVIISDTAGIRNSSDIIEQEGVTRALQKAEVADLKLIVFEQNIVAEFFSLIDERSLLIQNKIDLDKGGTEVVGDKAVIKISAKFNQGIDDLIEAIKSYLTEFFTYGEQSIIVHKRHVGYLEQALTHLREFSFAKPIELAAEDLRLAMRAIGSITGHINHEEVLGVIFSNFCIGK